MTRQLKRTEIDDAQWNACVDSSPDGHAFFYTWYLDSVMPGWSAMVEGDYQSIFPVTKKKKLGISYLLQPIFSRYTGYLSPDGFDTEKATAMLQQLSENTKYIDIALHERHAGAVSSFTEEQRVFQRLDLSRSYEEIQSGYSDNLIRNLKKAVKHQLELSKGILPHEIVDGFRRHQKEVSKQFTGSNYKTLLHLMRKADEHHAAVTLGVISREKELLAAACFIKTGNTLLYLKGFSSEEGKTKGAMHFLFDHIIQQNAVRMNWLDFGGSNLKNVARFYQSYGARDVVYLRIRKNNLPKALRWLKR
ncbi:MAG: hypothetical protein U0Y08_04825 [Bacteroidia bacterium]